MPKTMMIDNLTDLIANRKVKTLSEGMRKVGYSKFSVQKKTPQVGRLVRERLKTVYGITEDLIKSRIGEVLNVPLKINKVEPDHILRAAEDGARILGMYAPEKHTVLTADLTSILEKLQNKKLSSSEAKKDNTITHKDNQNDKPL